MSSRGEGNVINNLAKPEDKQRILLKDNILVKTKYELNLAENRLYNLLLYKFQKEGSDFKCRLSHKEIKEVIKHKELNTVKGIDRVLDRLSLKKVFIEEKKPNGRNSLWHNYKLIDGFTYDDEFNTFEIKATARIYDLLKQKFENGGYTPSNLNLFLSLNNYYAQRLYDLLRLWSGSKAVINYSIEELKEYLMLVEQYPEYGNFKRRVIAPAIKELNKSGCFDIDIVENKVSRKVVSIDFIVKDLDKRVYFSKDVIEIIESKDTKNPFKGKDGFKEINDSTEKGTQEKNDNLNLENIISTDTFYVPNKKLFTAKTLESFKDDFKNFDFKDSKNKKALQEAVIATLDKEDEEKIKVKAYNYFKATLKDRLQKLDSQKSDNKRSSYQVKTRFHNINQSFDKFTEDELEKHLFEQQSQKGMQTTQLFIDYNNDDESKEMAL